uniref:Uncharacterized protein n=1 Tax=Magallana gigas TaxID=29159 RepID=K1QS91_MAGGI
MLQHGLRRKKPPKTQEISQAPIPMTSDDEDIPLSTICEMIGTSPDLDISAVVAGRVVEKELVTGMRKVLAETFCQVRVLINEILKRQLK